VIYENYLKGRKRALWISVSNDLKYDAERDLADIGNTGIEVRKRPFPGLRIRIRINFGSWIRIRISVKSWSRIRIRSVADPDQLFILCLS
jgi:hypothetical protein